MSTTVINFPDSALFTTEIEIGAEHINAANHVSNYLYVEFCNQVVLRYYQSRGETPYTVNGSGMINPEYTVKLKSEAREGDVLVAELAVDNCHHRGCDFLFRFRNKQTGKKVALVRLVLLTFSYESGKVVEMKGDVEEFFKGELVL